MLCVMSPATPLQHFPDDRLVALFRAGREEAFGALHDRYRPALVAFARRLVQGSGHDPEDVVQDAFLRAHTALRATDAPMTVKPWLYTIVRNRALDLLRSPHGRGAELEEGRHLSLVPAADPERATEQRDRLRRMVDGIGRLPERQRVALVSRELEGVSHADMAARLGTSVQGTKSLLIRARAQLRAEEAAAA
jgi:RNA polymerase sigma factor (sigma-70 family)